MTGRVLGIDALTAALPALLAAGAVVAVVVAAMLYAYWRAAGQDEQ